MIESISNKFNIPKSHVRRIINGYISHIVKLVSQNKKKIQISNVGWIGRTRQKYGMNKRRNSVLKRAYTSRDSKLFGLTEE